MPRCSKKRFKKEIFTALDSNFILKDKLLNVSWDNLLVAIEKLDEGVGSTFEMLEPKKSPAKRAQSAPFEDRLCARLPLYEEIQMHFEQNPETD